MCELCTKLNEVNTIHINDLIHIEYVFLLFRKRMLFIMKVFRDGSTKAVSRIYFNNKKTFTKVVLCLYNQFEFILQIKSVNKLVKYSEINVLFQ